MLFHFFPAELQQTPNSRLVYLDETGFNMHTYSHYCYSPKNMEAVRMVIPFFWPAKNFVNIKFAHLRKTLGTPALVDRFSIIFICESVLRFDIL